MKTPQTLLDDLQFTHSMWLNELSHAEVTLSLFAHRLSLHDTNRQSEHEMESIGLIQVEIEQLLLAIAFIKKDILKHVIRLNKKTKLNGELKAMLNGPHEETHQRVNQLRNQVGKVKDQFYGIVPVEV